MPQFRKKEKVVVAVLIVLGIFLRLHHYLENRSFWLDEAYVALDITVRSFQQMFTGVSFSSDLPIPPVGFSLVEKFLVQGFGNNEYSLRVFPLLTGIISLPLFYLFLKRYASPQSRLLALGLFVFSDPLIYYSAELKPYSSDVFWALIIYLSAYDIDAKPLKRHRYLFFGLLGTIAVFFSYPSIFVLAGIGLAQIIRFKKDKERLLRLLFSYCLWLLGFLLQYLISVRSLIHNNGLISDAKSMGFLSSAPIWSLHGIQWFFGKTVNIFNNPVEIVPPILGGGLFLLGLKGISARNRSGVFYLCLPPIFVLMAVLWEKYIFAGRLLLFCVPSLLWGLSEGAVLLLGQIKDKTSVKISTILLIVALFAPSIKTTARYLVYPRGQEEVRPAMEYLKKYHRSGDAIYYNNSAQYAIGYYNGYLHLDCPSLKMGKFSDEMENGGRAITLQYDYYQCAPDGHFYGTTKSEQAFRVEAGNLKEYVNRSRTWIVLSHIRDEYKQKMLQVLRTGGKEIQFFEAAGAAVSLFDFSSSAISKDN